jgi:hypothetical protein
MRICKVELIQLPPFVDALDDRRKVTMVQMIQALFQFLDAEADRQKKISSMRMIQMMLSISRPKVMSLKEMRMSKKIGTLVHWLGD